MCCHPLPLARSCRFPLFKGLFSRLLLLLFAAGMLAASTPADAQVIRPSQSFYARIGAGTSVSETDASTYAVEPYSLNGELGYQLTPSLGVGLGLTYADYPKATDLNTRMTTVQGLARWTLFPDQPLTPYFNVGPQLTLGGDNPAAGALFGLGVDYVVTRRTSVFLDATAYATFPDDAIDSRDDGRATFDGLGFWGAGVRTSLNAAPAPVELYPIEGPLRVYRGETVRFTARATDASSFPITYAWELGDGTKTDGLVAEHTYRLEGDYIVSVRADNAGGDDTETVQITVEERPVAPRILSMSADTVRAYTHQLIRFAAHLKGSAPLDAVWTFGDGTPQVVERSGHAYDRDRYIGQMASDVHQGYVFEKPGEYRVSLSAENRFGADEATVIVQIEPQMQVVNATVPVNPCYQQTAIDTVYFDFDRATLDTESYTRLEDAANRLKQCPNQLVRIDGYADWVGTTDYNAELSYRRAEEVQRVYATYGIDPDRIVLRGQGELQPPCADASLDQPGKKGCRSFRRVESVVVMDETPLASASAEPILQEAVMQPAHAVQARAERGVWVVSVGWYESLTDAYAAAESARSAYGSRLASDDGQNDNTQNGQPPLDLYVVEADTHEPGFRLVIGPLSSHSHARATKSRLKSDIPHDAWLYKLDRPLPTLLVNRR